MRPAVRVWAARRAEVAAAERVAAAPVRQDQVVAAAVVERAWAEREVRRDWEGQADA